MTIIAPRRPLMALMVIMLVGLLIPAVSAEYYTFDLTEESYYASSGGTTGSSYSVSNRDLKYLVISDSEHLYGKTISHVFCQISQDSLENYDDLGSSVSTRVTIGDWGRATYAYVKYELLGKPRIQIYLYDFEYLSDYPIGLAGKERFLLTPDDEDFVFPRVYKGFDDYDRDYDLGIAIAIPTSNLYPKGTHYYSFTEKWENTLIIDTQPDRDKITLNRHGIISRIDIITSTDKYEESTTNDFELILFPTIHRPYSVIVTNPISDNTYSYNINNAGILQDGQTDPGDPGDPPAITVYIKNSQTGALIANSNIIIDALVNGEYYPVVNRSEPSGIFSINLQPTGGGQPNPDGYRLIVTADGYNNPMPEINFTVDDYKQSIYCLLDPIAGGPVDENKTFIDFFVSDRFANPIPGATVKFGKYTLITNSAGYTVFEVPKNDYYTYTVSKSGYNTITGNANIGDAPRNTINTYLTPVTTPPTQPTDWPTTPTPPTGGIPDEDDDSDGFLMQSVRGIANLFGVSFGVGKTILGMLLALGIGTATAKQLKGGAQEFGMGMLGGVVLGVLAGLLPIWVLVLLVLIVGLWIGQRYMSGGDS